MSEILVLYYSGKGTTKALAREVCHGVDSVDGMAARLRTVPAVSAVTQAVEDEVPDSGPPYAAPKDLADCAGLIVGSPTRFGNMDAALNHYLDGTVNEWFSAAAVGKPAAVFTSTSSLHGGQESTLLTHGCAITAPWHDSRRATLYRRSANEDKNRGHALWRQPCHFRPQERRDIRRRKDACASSRKTRRGDRQEAHLGARPNL